MGESFPGVRCSKSLWETISPLRGAGMGSRADVLQLCAITAPLSAHTLPLAKIFANKEQGTLCICRCVPQGDIMIKEKRKTKFTRVLLNALLPKSTVFNSKKARCK